ncbi:MAG: hypothetical protein ACKO1V_00915 [Cyanobium sp.]
MALGEVRMTEEEKWQYLVDLDEQLLQGGVILSEWATFLIKDADTAFAGGAHLASIITGLAGAETYLRSEGAESKQRFVELIDESDLEEDLKQELHTLRRYRNKWVHVAGPWDDTSLLKSPEKHESELVEMARRCAVALRRTIYSNPWI